MKTEKCFALLCQYKLKIKTRLNIVCFSCNLKEKQNRTSKRRLKRGYLVWMFFMSLDHKFSTQIMTMVPLSCYLSVEVDIKERRKVWVQQAS